MDCRDNAPSTWPVQRIAAETILGAQLSEVLNAEVTSNEKGGFSRRRVMKGVAWTVPVIVAAVGAPPAAASPGPFNTLLVDASASRDTTFAQFGNAAPGQNRPGQGPVSFHVTNKSGAPSGAISGTITIESPDKVDPGVGIVLSKFTQGVLTPKTLPAGSAYFADFSLSGGIANTATAVFPLAFYYTGTDKRAAPNKQFKLTISFTTPAGLAGLSATLVLGAG